MSNDVPSGGCSRTDSGTERQIVSATLDTVFELASVQRRRHLLASLTDGDADVFDLDTLVEQVQTAESRATDGPPPDYDTVLVALHHAHLPKLAAAGVIDYDARSQTARIRSHSLLANLLSTFMPPDRVAEADVDGVFTVLRHRYRRVVLSHLRACQSPVPIEELAQQIAAREDDCSVSDVTAEQTERIRNRLIHQHLPKLADRGLINYDRQTELAASEAITGLVAEYVVLSSRYEPETA